MGASAFFLSMVAHKIDVAECTAIVLAGCKLEILGTQLRVQLVNVSMTMSTIISESESTPHQPVLYQGIWMPCTKFLVRRSNVQ